MRRWVATCALCVGSAGGISNAQQAAEAIEPPDGELRVAFTDAELRLIFQHSPLPAVPPDPTNNVADDSAAAHFGRYLFFDTRLSGDNSLSCSTCHDPTHGFSLDSQFSQGAGTTSRHAQSLWNVGYNRWYYWDGSVDSLWSQALKPIEGADEMNSSRLALAHTIAREPDLRRGYEHIFGGLPDLSDPMRFPTAGKPRSHKADDVPEELLGAWQSMTPDDHQTINTIFANVGKTIAAYERKIVSRDSAFDRFVEGLHAGDEMLTSALSPSAQRGLQLFIGRANCRLCHTGPNFSDGEFHSLGLINHDGTIPNDAARFEGATKVKSDPFNAAGAFSDDPDAAPAKLVQQLVVSPETWGQYKTPSLRSVATSPPYMHQGQFVTLHDVVDFYSSLEGRVQMGHHQETILQPLELSEVEKADLVSFLRSLTGQALTPELSARPSGPLPSASK